MKSGYWTREFICGAFPPDYPLLEQRRKEIGTALSCSYHYPHNCRRIYDTAFKRMVQFFLQRFAEL